MAEETPKLKIKNPFRPGAGHMPPFLAGRENESKEFEKLLEQETILHNLVLTGLRGLGKTVLLETFKPIAIEAGWLWVGTDMSESTSISEENLSIRLLTDLSVVTTGITITTQEPKRMVPSGAVNTINRPLDFFALKQQYDGTAGLVADKLKSVLESVWGVASQLKRRGIIFAYDEAQNLADHSAKEQYPLSLLLDVFQSIQRKGIPFLLVLTGLPTLFPKLVEARTFSERMFRVIFLEPLDQKETYAAIRKPIQKDKCPVDFSDSSVKLIWEITRGYPYFVQYVCRESFDVWVQAIESGKPAPAIPSDAIMRKLDTDFFAGRWSRATDRQRELLRVVSYLDNCESEFTVLDVAEHIANTSLDKPFGASHINQIFVVLSQNGLIYKNRHGKYSFAVPLLRDFIRRQFEQQQAPTLF